MSSHSAHDSTIPVLDHELIKNSPHQNNSELETCNTAVLHSDSSSTHIADLDDNGITSSLTRFSLNSPLQHPIARSHRGFTQQIRPLCLDGQDDSEIAPAKAADSADSLTDDAALSSDTEPTRQGKPTYLEIPDSQEVETDLEHTPLRAGSTHSEARSTRAGVSDVQNTPVRRNGRAGSPLEITDSLRRFRGLSEIPDSLYVSPWSTRKSQANTYAVQSAVATPSKGVQRRLDEANDALAEYQEDTQPSSGSQASISVLTDKVDELTGYPADSQATVSVASTQDSLHYPTDSQATVSVNSILTNVVDELTRFPADNQATISEISAQETLRSPLDSQATVSVLHDELDQLAMSQAAVFEETPDIATTQRVAKKPSARVTGWLAKASDNPVSPSLLLEDTNHLAALDLLADASEELLKDIIGPECTLDSLRQSAFKDKLKNIRRLVNVDLTVTSALDVQPSWTPTRNLDSILRLPLREDTDWICTSAERGTLAQYTQIYGMQPRQCWIFTFENRNPSSAGPKTFVAKEANNIRVKAVANEAAARKVGDRVCEHLNRWPADPPMAEDRGASLLFWPYLLFKAFWDVFPDHVAGDAEARVHPFKRAPIVYRVEKTFTNGGDYHGPLSLHGLEVTVASQGGSLRAFTKGFAFDLNGKSVSHGIFSSPTIQDWMADIEVPTDVPQWWFDLYGSTVYHDQVKHISGNAACEKVARLMQVMMYYIRGSLGNFSEVQCMLDKHKHNIFGSSMKWSRLLLPYFTHRSWALKRARAGKALWPTISVFSTSRTHVAYVMEATTQHYSLGTGLGPAYTFGALTADLINHDCIKKEHIRASVQRCRVVPHEAQPHICQHCLQSIDCDALVYVDYASGTYRLCLHCALKDVGTNEMAGRLNISSMIRNKVSSDMKRSVGSDWPMSTAEAASTTSVLLEHLTECIEAGTSVVDKYCPGIMRNMHTKIEFDRSTLLRDPFQPSVDAISPIAEVDGRLRLHTPSNVAWTSLYINYMKGTWPVGLVQIISDHQRARHSKSDDEHSREQTRNKLDNIYALTHECSYTVKGRMTSQTKARLPELKERWRTCIADRTATPAGLWQCSILNVSPGHHAMMVHIPIANSMITQMEAEFGGRVPRSEDGAPWPWIESHRPVNWSWRALFTFMGDRLIRFDEWCDDENDHSQENSYRLLIECLRQYLQFGGVDQFLGLEMTPWPRHPARAAVTHLHHGQAMRTGCLIPFPSDFKRHYDVSKSNILWETCVSNYAKSNFKESRYPDMLKDLMNVNLSEELFRPPKGDVLPIAQLALLRRDPKEWQGSVGDAQDDVESDNEAAEGDFAEEDAMDDDD